jgi:molybdate transport system ATP-binding protein
VVNGFRCEIEVNRPAPVTAKFDVAEEMAVLLGPSGSGKSTLLNCIAGLLKPDAGKIESNQITFFDSSKSINLQPQQRKIGYVFQHSYLFPHLTVFENIAFGLNGQSAQKTKDRVAELVTQFHVAGTEHKKPSQLSGGQIQRVALARALAIEPQLLLLDEPFSALDPDLREELGQELLSVQRKLKLPVLMVTHSREEAARLADTVIFLKEGSVSQQRNENGQKEVH